MASQSIEDYEILCIVCGRTVDEEQVRIIANEMAPDFEVLCPECYERYLSSANVPSSILVEDE